MPVFLERCAGEVEKMVVCPGGDHIAHPTMIWNQRVHPRHGGSHEWKKAQSLRPMVTGTRPREVVAPLQVRIQCCVGQQCVVCYKASSAKSWTTKRMSVYK